METLARAANRGSVSTGYEIANSLKFESDNTENLTRTPSSASNQKTWTWSGWVKYTEPDLSPQTLWAGGTGSGDGSFNFRIDAGTISVNTATTTLRASTAKFRDPSAWYHFVMVMDTTQSTANDRIKVYVNGSQITDFSTTNNPSQNADMGVNSAQLHALGRRSNAADRYFSGYMAEVNFVDGTALTPTDFGEFDEDSGIWKPKAYTGSFGTNGWYLDFVDGADLGDDESGNGNDFTENNITAADQATDTPTNNFCTMNVLRGGIVLGGTTYNRIPLMTEGATVVGNNSTNYTFSEATMGVTSGKWYWEMKPTVNANTLVSGAGIATNTEGSFAGTDGVGNFFYHYDGNKYVNGAGTGYGAAWTTNDIIGFAYDADNWTLTCYINNSSQGNLLSGTADLSAEIVIPYMYSYGTHTYQWNFGGYTASSISSAATDENGYGTFEYAPPSGYYALCTKNLAEFG